MFEHDYRQTDTETERQMKRRHRDRQTDEEKTHRRIDRQTHRQMLLKTSPLLKIIYNLNY